MIEHDCSEWKCELYQVVSILVGRKRFWEEFDSAGPKLKARFSCESGLLQLFGASAHVANRVEVIANYLNLTKWRRV